MRDVPDAETDETVSQHILGIHRGVVATPPIPLDFLRKYIAYAQTITPILSVEAAERIKSFYNKMRKASSDTEGSPITISPRQLEALVRVAEARARALTPLGADVG